MVPAAIAAADIVSATRIQAGASAQAITLPAVGKYAAIVINGTTGGFYGVQFSDLALSGVPAVNYPLFAPNNTALLTGAITRTNLSGRRR